MGQNGLEQAISIYFFERTKRCDCFRSFMMPSALELTTKAAIFAKYPAVGVNASAVALAGDPTKVLDSLYVAYVLDDNTMVPKRISELSPEALELLVVTGKCCSSSGLASEVLEFVHGQVVGGHSATLGDNVCKFIKTQTTAKEDYEGSSVFFCEEVTVPSDVSPCRPMCWVLAVTPSLSGDGGVIRTDGVYTTLVAELFAKLSDPGSPGDACPVGNAVGLSEVFSKALGSLYRSMLPPAGAVAVAPAPVAAAAVVSAPLAAVAVAPAPAPVAVAAPAPVAVPAAVPAVVVAANVAVPRPSLVGPVPASTAPAAAPAFVFSAGVTPSNAVRSPGDVVFVSVVSSAGVVTRTPAAASGGLSAAGPVSPVVKQLSPISSDLFEPFLLSPVPGPFLSTPVAPPKAGGASSSNCSWANRVHLSGSGAAIDPLQQTRLMNAHVRSESAKAEREASNETSPI